MDAATKAPNQSFDLSICRLLQEYPLYDYRTPESQRFRLPVLLIGRGDRLRLLCGKLLSNGQLLDTQLEVTMVTDCAGAEAAALDEAAPDLGRFINIRGTGKDRDAGWDCGTLRFEPDAAIGDNLPRIIAAHPQCRYVVISTESEADPPASLAPVPGKVIAWVKKVVLPPTAHRPEPEPQYEIHVCSPRRQVFLPACDDNALRPLLDIAYRLHYAYEKGNDPHSTNQEIRARFNDPYNYKSNIECALHIRSKIKSAGIDPASLDCAAEEFARKMAEDMQRGGDLLERLAQLEHRRWCVSKAAGGRCKPERLDVIYGDDGSTTHSDRWHVALVPYGSGGQLCRHLAEQDWTAEDPEAIGGLDELDRQTLRVHRQCAVIADKKLRHALTCIEQLKVCLPPQAHICLRAMKDAIGQMRRGSREAVFLYNHHLRRLEPHTAGHPEAEAITKELGRAMGAPIEYLTRKDYKKQNLVLVGSIPFALCGWKSTVLVKLMAESIHECVAAAWQLEPGHVIFVDTAESMEELKQLRGKARQIDHFLTSHCNLVRSSYHIFVPGNASYYSDRQASLRLGELQQDDPAFFGTGDWTLHPYDSLDANGLRRRFVDLMQRSGATSMDLTGGKPTLISLADGYARNSRAGAFYIRGDQIRDFYGARSMEWQALDKGLTVQQLFDQTEADLIKRDDLQISPVFYEQYDALWRIAHRYAAHWYRFCLCFSRVYRDQSGAPDPDALLRVPVQNLHERFAGEFRDCQAQFDTILAALCRDGILKRDQAGVFYQASCEEVLACLRNSGKVLEYYIYCTVRHAPVFQDAAMSWMFRHAPNGDAAKNEVDIICTAKKKALFISAKNVTADSLGRNNFLNYICYEVGWLADRFGGVGPVTVLAAPNVQQFENGKRSQPVRRAMSRGVYLLGDRCFEPGNLIRVLENIVRGRKRWCEFLLDTP